MSDTVEVEVPRRESSTLSGNISDLVQAILTNNKQLQIVP